MRGWWPGHGHDHRAPVVAPDGRSPRRRAGRNRFDPPPRSLGEWAQRLWVVGLVAVVLVLVLVVATGPADLSILTRLFVLASTFAFSVWLLREHRRRIPVRQRLIIFTTCLGVLAVLLVVLTVSAF